MAGAAVSLGAEPTLRNAATDVLLPARLTRVRLPRTPALLLRGRALQAPDFGGDVPPGMD